jgi:hypothetical protein
MLPCTENNLFAYERTQKKQSDQKEFEHIERWVR